VTEDYKPRDVECASVALALCRGIRARYPDWRYLLDGDGGTDTLTNVQNLTGSSNADILAGDSNGNAINGGGGADPGAGAGER